MSPHSPQGYSAPPLSAVSTSSLGSWLTFLMERAPPLIFILLAAGPCLTCLYATEGYINPEKFMWALIGQLVRRAKIEEIHLFYSIIARFYCC